MPMLTADQIIMRTNEAVEDTIADLGPESELNRDEIYPDMLAAIITSEDCSDKEAAEACRRTLGWVPGDVRRLKPGVVRYEEKWLL